MTRRTGARKVVGVVGVVVAALAAVGCGSDGGSESDVSAGDPDDARDAQDGTWSSQLLESAPGADQPTLLAADGDQVVVVVVSEEGGIAGFSAGEDGRFLAGEPAATASEFLQLGGLARFEDGWIALGSGGRSTDGEELLFEVRAFASDDGRTWSALDAGGFDGPADVMGLTSVDEAGAVVGVGTLRGAEDPAIGGFRPVAWHSRDGERWTTVELPMGDGAEGSARAVVDTGDEVLAVGQVDQRGVMWSSADGGATWEIVERDGVPPASSLDHLVAQGDVLVLSGTGGGAEAASRILVRSTDGGDAWRDAAAPPPPGRGTDAGFGSPVSAGGGQFFTLTSSFVESWSEPELCYADIELCRQDSVVALYASGDGDRWRRIDTSGIGEGQPDPGEIDAITATDDGRIVALRREATGIGTWTWPAGASLPTGDEPVDPTTDVDLLEPGETPEPGRRYAVPLYIHCGMDWLYVGDEAWHRTDDGPAVETGAGDTVPDNWPEAQQTVFGFATLVDDDLIEYSIGDGEVIATYRPATEEPPGCD